jgi:kinesin family protein 3/17
VRQREVNTVLAEKEKCEQIIRELEAQVLHGGQKVEETPEFRQAIQKEQDRLEQETAQKLAELQSERERLQLERAEFERERHQFMETMSVRSAPDGEPVINIDTAMQLASMYATLVSQLGTGGKQECSDEFKLTNFKIHFQ